MNELLPLLAIAGVIFGVFLSIAKGYYNRPEGDTFKVGRLLSSLIIGVMGTLSVSMLVISQLSAQLNELGLVGLTFVFIAQGFGFDQGLSQLDK